MIVEGTDEFSVDYSYYQPRMDFTIRDQYANYVQVNLGPNGLQEVPKKVDVMKMSFVIELVLTNEFPESPRDEDQVWFKESSASLLEEVDYITGNCRIRELHAGEQAQMNKLKQSPHETSHEFKVIYKNGKTHIQSNVKATVGLNFGIMGNNLSLMTSHNMNGPDMKSANLWDIEGKSFLIEDAAKSNCENFESLGLGSCMGNIWIEKL